LAAPALESVKDEKRVVGLAANQSMKSLASSRVPT
jgi:hypothetical protein